MAQGDAEDLPFATDSFDRYVSAGSIEYWPEPQRGIKEAYRCGSATGPDLIANIHGFEHPCLLFQERKALVGSWCLMTRTAQCIKQ